MLKTKVMIKKSEQVKKVMKKPTGSKSIGALSMECFRIAKGWTVSPRQTGEARMT